MASRLSRPPPPPPGFRVHLFRCVLHGDFNAALAGFQQGHGGLGPGGGHGSKAACPPDRWLFVSRDSLLGSQTM